jgi:PAS domain S-box-containing protein
MELQVEDLAQETKRLQRCINDLVSVLALPAIWQGNEPSQIVQTLLDVLLRMLGLEFAYARLNDAFDARPVEILRVAEPGKINLSSQELRKILSDSCTAGTQDALHQIGYRLGNEEISIVPVPLGIQGEIGRIMLGCVRAGFPSQTEKVLLSVAANQACIGLQEARFRNQQRHIAEELDQRVAQRTAELAAANAELQLQVGLLQQLPVSAWTLKPDGTPDFVNQVWLEFSGQALDFVRSHPEAWMSAVHPEDREAAAKSFWEGVHSGRGFAFESRSLRAKDGTYRWHLQQATVLRDADGKVLRFVGTTTDIDDLKVAQEELKKSERDLRLIIDTIPTQLWWTHADGSTHFHNQRYLDYIGLSEEQLQAWGWLSTLHPDDLDQVASNWQRIIDSGSAGEGEVRWRGRDGTYRWFLYRVSPLRGENGKIVKWYGILTDIEDRKRAEEAVRARELILRRIIDAIPTLSWCFLPDGSNEFLNKGWHEYTGFTPEESHGWGWKNAIHPDDLPALMEKRRVLIAAEESGEMEARLRRHDGVYRWFLIRIAPFRDESDKIHRWYGTSTDIEDRKRAEEAVVASERNLRLTINTVPALAWSAQADGHVDFQNQRWLDYTGLSPEQAQGWGWARAFHPEDIGQLNDYWVSRITTGQPGEIEARLRRFDGCYRWFLFRMNPLRDESGAVVKWYGINTDIDDRKRAEEELRNAQSELARVVRVTTMGQLTASIAHEVNQPLSGIITNAGTCLRMLDANPPNLEGARETVRRTIRDGNRAADVITRLRTLYSKKEPTLESMDLNEVAREVTALSSTEIQRNQVTLRQEFANDLPPALGDRIQLQQVILNLLRNAADAMSTVDDHPRELLVKTERDEGNRVRLSVKDSGVGFTPQAADKIFDAFYTTKTDGMGIGLSISRSIIEAHHGRLWATRNDGPGSTFSFSIPCSPEGSRGPETRANRADPSMDAP